MIINRGTRGALSEINVTPLVDVMLVLLIIFMVTAPLMQEGISVNLPKVVAAPLENTEDSLILTITGGERIYIEKTELTLSNLPEKLAAILKTKKNKSIYIRADSGAKYGFVMQVLSAIRTAGIEEVGLITVPPEKEAQK
jgi:biopolymer transport protein TolR